MKTEQQHIEDLKRAVAKRFARTLDAPTDYDALALDIASITGESVSVSTLKRLFGYDKHSTTPRPSTLSTLSRYVGYTGWSDFCGREEMGVEPSPKRAKLARKGLYIAILAMVIAVVIIGILISAEPGDTANTEPTEPLPTKTTAEDIRNKWTQLSVQKCDSIRTYRQELAVVEYSKVIDNFYFAFVFDEAKRGIAEDIDALANISEEEKVALKAEIASSCQNICVELMREIADELNSIHAQEE